MAVIYKEIVIGRLPNGFAGDTPVCGFDAIGPLARLGKQLQRHIIKTCQLCCFERFDFSTMVSGQNTITENLFFRSQTPF